MRTFDNLHQALHEAFKQHSTQVWIEYMCGRLATEKLCQGIYQAVGDFQILDMNNKVVFSSKDAVIDTTIKNDGVVLIEESQQ